MRGIRHLHATDRRCMQAFAPFLKSIITKLQISERRRFENRFGAPGARGWASFPRIDSGKKATTLLPIMDSTRQRLEKIRLALLALHKALVDSERVSYEKTMGSIPSPNHFLQLLTKDPWFAWLQPLSLLIVSMDEALDAKEPLTTAEVEAVVREAGLLLAASENGEGFARHYFEALQRDPDVVLAHAEAAKLIGARRRSSH